MKNQCDGCRRGLPVRDGTHYGKSPFDAIGCTADRYCTAEELADLRKAQSKRLVVFGMQEVSEFIDAVRGMVSATCA